jgi:hypothetical protein
MLIPPCGLTEGELELRENERAQKETKRPVNK